MRKKKLVTALTISAMMVLSLGSIVAEANNEDTDFNFTFNNETVKTGLRTKADSTSSYMKCNKATKSYTAHVYGWYQGMECDCSYGHSYVFTTGTTHFMLNDVYEKGYSSAGIAANRNYAAVYSASGKWSPDSV